MTFRFMRRVDALLGVVPDYFVSWLRCCLGRAGDVSGRPLVVCKFFGIGSLVSFFRELERFDYSEYDIYLVTFRQNEDVIELFPWVNAIYVESSSFIKFVRSYVRAVVFLLRLRAGALLDVEFYSRATSLLEKISAPSDARLIGFWDFDYCRRRGYTHPIPFTYVHHITTFYYLALRSAGVKRREPAQDVTPDAGMEARGNIVLVNPNSSNLALGRRWPAERFGSLVAKLAEELPALTFCITGSAKEQSVCKEVVSRSKELAPSASVYNCAGVWKWREFLDQIRSACLLITNDSGPVHLAAYFNCPSVTIWGPSSPWIFGPRNHTLHKWIWKGYACSPCMYFRGKEAGGFCGYTFPCVSEITVDEVYALCRNYLRTLLKQV